MNKSGTDWRKRQGKFLCALLAALLLTGLCASAAADDTDAFLLINPELILAQDTADDLGLQGVDGGRLIVRIDPDVPGRGGADAEGNEPVYSGLLGFAALPKDPEIGKSSVFSKPSWQVPVYRKSKNGNTMVKGGSIAHKTPVLVTRQRLKENGKGGYTGWLEIVRLDTGSICYLQVSCFVTAPYWNLPLTETPAYGYCIGVYRESPGEAPQDETGKTRTFRDGTKVLVPFEGAVPMNSPDPEKLIIQGIVFTEHDSGTAVPEVIYFREADLIVLY